MILAYLTECFPCLEDVFKIRKLLAYGHLCKFKSMHYWPSVGQSLLRPEVALCSLGIYVEPSKKLNLPQVALLNLRRG
jgi:hypothetical protein